jgi:ubiquinone biosynthesis protein
VASYFVELSDPDEDFDLDAFRHEVANTLAPFMRLRLGDVPTGDILRELARISAAHGAPMPRDLVLFIKTLVTLEALGHKLHPQFEVFPVAERFAKEIVKELYSVDSLKRRGLSLFRDVQMLARHAPYQIRRILKSTADGTLTVRIQSDDHAAIAHAIESTGVRKVRSQMAGMVFLGSSIMMAAGIQLASRKLIGVAGAGFIVAGVLGFGAIFGGNAGIRRR